MSKVVIGVIVGAIALVGLAVISPKDQTASASFSAVQKDISSGAKLYDVRTPQEYTAGHFENATNLSLQDMQAGNLPDVDKDTKLYVYCQSGNRSSQAAAILKDAGFTAVVDLGGLQKVQTSGGKLNR